MRVGVLVTARLGSSRLRRKHLLPVSEKPIMGYLLDRIAGEFSSELATGSVVTVIASSNEPENREFEIFSSCGAKLFLGSVNNIPLRHLQAADSLGLDAIVAVDGDDILCSRGGMREVYRTLAGGSPYVRTTGLPFGMNSFGYSRGFLAASMEGHRESVLETGWGQIFSENAVKDIPLSVSEPDDRLRFTLDYQEDYSFFSAVIEKLGEGVLTADDEEIVRVVKEQGLYALNESIAREYWANFYRCMERERGN